MHLGDGQIVLKVPLNTPKSRAVRELNFIRQNTKQSERNSRTINSTSYPEVLNGGMSDTVVCTWSVDSGTTRRPEKTGKLFPYL